jgi:hypothetical protein
MTRICFQHSEDIFVLSPTSADAWKWAFLSAGEKLSMHILRLPEQLLTLDKTSTRILITTHENPDLFWQALEHVLRSSWCKRLLVLTPTVSRPELLVNWPHIPFLQERRFFWKRFPTQFAPTFPLRRNTRVCIATIREMQVQQKLHCLLRCSPYDCVVIYKMPGTLSPVWMQVLEQFEKVPLIGFSETAAPATRLWFRQQEEREHEATPLK